jgi:hypothetical protein
MDKMIGIKQTIEFNKSVFKNSFTAMTIAQDQSEQMFMAFLDQNPMIPEEGKKAVEQWFKTYKTGAAEFKKIAEDSFAKIEGYFNK